MLKRYWALMLSPLCCLSQGTAASIVGVQATAEVIRTTDITAQAAQLLVSPAPGVLTLTIPGSVGSPASAVQLTATAAAGGGTGALAFTATATVAAAVSTAQLLAVVTEAASSPGESMSLSTALATEGVLSTQGVQVAVLSVTKGLNGGGSVSAIITFD